MTTSGFERLLNLISSRLLDGYEAYVSSEIINDVLNCTIRLIKNEDVFKIVYSIKSPNNLKGTIVYQFKKGQKAISTLSLELWFKILTYIY